MNEEERKELEQILPTVEEFVVDVLDVLDLGGGDYGLRWSARAKNEQLQEIYALVKKYFSGM